MVTSGCEECWYYQLSHGVKSKDDNIAECLVNGAGCEDCRKYAHRCEPAPTNYEYILLKNGIPKSERPTITNFAQMMIDYKDGDLGFVAQACWLYWGQYDEYCTDLKKVRFFLNSPFKELTPATAAKRGLELCPLCGGESEMISIRHKWYVHCLRCGCNVTAHRKYAVRNLWNTRV